MSGNPLIFEDLWAILRRRKLHFGIPAAIILLSSIALAYSLTPVFVSTATILIEEPEIPENLVASTVTGFASERIQMIRNRVMTNDNLWAIAEKIDLYPGERTIENQQAVIKKMRENIGLDMVTSEAVDPKNGRAITPTIAFTVSFGNESPELAQAVASELAQRYITEDRSSRTQSAQQASSFLKDEAQRLQDQISDLEARTAAFKAKNAGSLPESFEATSRFLQTAQQQLEQLDAKMAPLESRYAFLKARLTGFGASAELVKARDELAAAREKYSEIYPEVIRLKQAVEALEAEVNQGGSSSDYGYASSDPAYLALQSELQQVGGEISAIRSQRADLNQKIAEYQSRLARSPEVEREYLALNRNLTHDISSYREIMEKLASAQLAEELERSQKAGRFTLVAAASYPTSPSKPNIPAIILLGFTFAIGVGVGVAGLAEYLDHRIYGPKDLAAVFNAPPIAIIPEIAG
ncbi:polysaccharide chain length determinant protein (PEP-CTERM system associated) [Thiogranum longum]|uniref:Polysaccharide chain length determinant protein (PEP-CTERM system associated) n=1 Tax=Thiogranum longum TaxID=1537524 RepID=A0A4R1HFR2_9GAMM|nr:GNVR domain-containing protein [Thiogranum longum]TCK18179.1 polysaccharide chain length determinant protein (PEP-CTERM system associated) [Thiogranum longum]